MTDQEFLELLSRHERLIYSICTTFAKGDREEMNDLYQEILCTLWENRSRFRGECSGKNWLYRVGLNTAISSWRKLTRRPTTVPLPSEMEQWLKDDAADPLKEELYKLIDRLPKADQSLLFLYIDGNSHKEIAEIMGISESNVSIRIHRIKQKLKTYNHE